MIKFEKTVTPSPEQWEAIIRGMRNPKNSWEKSDSFNCLNQDDCTHCPAELHNKCSWDAQDELFYVGENDRDLMMRLANGGPVHAKYRRMIVVYVDITAPLYWWKEFDTYKIGTVANSCSTMHKIHEKMFELDDFSHEHLAPISLAALNRTIIALEYYRCLYVNGGDDLDENENKIRYEPNSKHAWDQMIQLLPSSYNQKRTIQMNYEVLVGIYKWRKNHKLQEWHDMCDWIETLPYSELITGEKDEQTRS